MSFQVKYISENSKNKKGDQYLGWSIIQTKSVFLCDGKKEEDIIGV